MVVYLVQYIDSKAVTGVFYTMGEAQDFAKRQIEHPSHYQVLIQDPRINPLYLEGSHVPTHRQSRR